MQEEDELQEEEDELQEEDKLQEEDELQQEDELPEEQMIITPTKAEIMLSTHVDLSVAPAVFIDRKGWPQWVRDWYTIFASKHFGAVWAALVARWTVIEQGYKWASPVSASFICEFTQAFPIPFINHPALACSISLDYWILGEATPTCYPLLGLSWTPHSILSPTAHRVC